MLCDGVDAKIGWHFCFGNAWGNDILSANFPEGYQTVLPHLWNTEGVDEFVLDYANRDMAGIEFLSNCPKDKGVQVGVLDIRTNMLETPDQVADRIRTVL
jgi:5-methyltetrahydropteroyltriglutamate--homocysteine methyltransferase